MKALIEKRNTLLTEMETIVDKAKTEVRAMDETENTRFYAIKTEVEGIDKTLKADTERRAMEMKKPAPKTDEPTAEDLEVRAFASFIRGEKSEDAEVRALDIASNGAIIPATIANKIITKVKEISPIYKLSTIYNVKGDLIFPVYDETTSAITCAYSADMEELTEKTGKFTNITLHNYVAGALAKVSKSLLNNTDFDLVSFVVSEMAKAIALFLEKELLQGTVDKMTGVLSSKNIVTTASATSITADELIDLQMTVPSMLQEKCIWAMNTSTFKALRKLKDAQGDYLLNKDITKAFGWALFDKPVYVSDNMPVIANGAKTIVYGDMSGLVVKLSKDVEIQVLLEKFATQHAIGVIGYIECDSQIIEPQKIAVLAMKA